jgi:hypothetical protein
MKFPGKRKSKHYFPVNARDPLLHQFQPENETSAAWVVGIDQTLVDIEAKVDDEFIERYGLSAGKFHGCFYGWLTERRMLTQSDGSARDAASFNISRRDRIFMAVVPYNDVI